ncbi:hypothetical protein [Acidisoma cladoniae]|uniref:hypothetical protein n=1 Tax=Acidisoma cladoniae TaxID=3040935 RepID=UPI00254B7789|nr:hypothetical protein [Acidisoma sp. PAMC 29798]
MMQSQTLSLDDLVERARNHTMRPSERRAQRMSLIMGLRSDDSTLTKDKVSTLLDQIEGHDAREPKP